MHRVETSEANPVTRVSRSRRRDLAFSGSARLRSAALLFIGIVLSGCAALGDRPGTQPVPAPATPVSVRPPEVGQQWVYRVRDMFSGRIVDTVTETVSMVSPGIRITRTSAKWGALPDELQSAWGQVTQDPHWTPVPVFARPLPLWPGNLAATDSVLTRDAYQPLGDPYGDLRWHLKMTPIGWESLTVKAGSFTTLHYTNQINFRSDEDYYRIESSRGEQVWLAPEVGRWVLRRSHGEYYVASRGGRTLEDYLQWELVSWH